MRGKDGDEGDDEVVGLGKHTMQRDVCTRHSTTPPSPTHTHTHLISHPSPSPCLKPPDNCSQSAVMGVCHMESPACQTCSHNPYLSRLPSAANPETPSLITPPPVMPHPPQFVTLDYWSRDGWASRVLGPKHGM